MKKARQVYESPEIMKVRLVKDELAVAGCKTTRVSMGPVRGCLRGLAGGCKRAGS
jgi:hypothetical protein